MLHVNLLKILADQDMTMSELSYRTGMSKTTLTSLTNNTGKGIQFDTLNRLCTELNVTPCDFFEFVSYDFEYELKYDENFEFGYYINLLVKNGNRVHSFDFGIMNWFGDIKDDFSDLDNKVYKDTDLVLLVSPFDLYETKIFKEKFYDDLPPVFKKKFLNNIKNTVIEGFNADKYNFGISPEKFYAKEELRDERIKELKELLGSKKELIVTFDIMDNLEYGKIIKGVLKWWGLAYAWSKTISQYL